MRYLIPALAVVLLTACSHKVPTFRGVNGPRTGFAGVDFAEADAQCMHETRAWSMSGYGDPFYKQLGGGQTYYTSYMQGKGFNPETQ